MSQFMDEHSILKNLANDSKGAMQALYNEYYTLLCNIAYLKLKDQNLARDIVQELMTELWKRRKSLNIKGSLKAYLIKSLTYKVSRTNRYTQSILEFEQHHDYKIDASNELEYKELKAYVNRVIEEMPTRVQECFLMSRTEGLTYKEIAAKLEISPKTVDHHISKALKILKEKLKMFK